MAIEIPHILNDVIILMLEEIEFDLTKNEDGGGTFVFKNNQVFTFTSDEFELFEKFLKDLDRELKIGEEEISFIVYDEEEDEEDEKGEYGFGGNWWNK